MFLFSGSGTIRGAGSLRLERGRGIRLVSCNRTSRRVSLRAGGGAAAWAARASATGSARSPSKNLAIAI